MPPMVWGALLAFLAAPQQDQTVFRTEKGDYPQAVRDCQAAEGLIDSDPRGAVEKLDAIITNSKIRKIECRIRIEERPAEYSPWSLFLPYQFRGRARLNLAKKAEREAAEKFLSGAVEDFQKSVDAGVKASEDLLKAAKAELERVRVADPAVPVDPLTRFTPGFQQLLRSNKFKSARAYVDAQGKDLTDAQRKAFADECGRRSGLYLGEQIDDFRRRLARLTSPRDLLEMTETAFAGLFDLPAPDELVGTDPALDWARAHSKTFAEVRSGRAGAETLLPAAAAAASIVPEGSNPWFAVVENLAFLGTQEAIRAAADQARDAAQADRDARRARAEGLLRPWTDLAGKFDPKFLDRHPAAKVHAADLARLMDDFPVDLPALDKIDLEACFADAAPLAKLKQQEEELRALEGGKAIARESRRKLYAAIVTAAALRLLVEGKSEAEAAQSLQAYGPRLKGAGGAPADAGKYGPRIEKVFQELLK